MKRMRFLYAHMKGYRGRFFFAAFVTVFLSFVTLFQSRLFSYVIDNVIDGKPVTSAFLQFMTNALGGMDYVRSHLYVVALILLGIYVLTAVLMYGRLSLQAEVAESLTKATRDDLYDHIQKLPYSYHVKAKTGDLIQRCTSDIDTIRRFFSGQALEIFSIFSTTLFAVITLFTISKKMSLVALLSYPAVFLYSYFFFGKVRKMFKASDEKESLMTSFLQEALSGVRVIKAFNREKYEVEAFKSQNREYTDVTYDMIKGLGSYWGISYFICMVGILFVLLASVFAVRNGEMSIGALYLFITYQTRVVYQIRNLGRILSDFGKVVVSIDRLEEIKEEKTEDLESGLTPELNGDITFENVSFHYDDDPDVEVLKNVSFHVNAGQTVAILGPTGSGKSSLVNLLARLYDVSEGRILLDGIDINEISKMHLRKNIGIVLQEPFLFSKSILDNLRIADPKRDKTDIYSASKIASIHDVIEGFDKGYDTLVGEKGVTLSGGQRQRIAIARTIVNHSPILVFDDSLSAVDMKTDASIRKALHTMDNSATMIIITQRTVSAKDADVIIVIEEGRVSDIGTHEELIHKEGLYKRVFEIQTRGKEGEDVQ